MIIKRTAQGTFGILVMTNVDLMFLDQDQKLNWFENYYFKIEKLLMQTAEEMLIQKTESN